MMPSYVLRYLMFLRYLKVTQPHSIVPRLITCIKVHPFIQYSTNMELVPTLGKSLEI